MADLYLDGKKLSELKLTEIKAELGKRSLPKKGNKGALFKILQKALRKEREIESEANNEMSSQSLFEEDEDISDQITSSNDPPLSSTINLNDEEPMDEGMLGHHSDAYGSPLSSLEDVRHDENEHMKVDCLDLSSSTLTSQQDDKLSVMNETGGVGCDSGLPLLLAVSLEEAQEVPKLKDEGEKGRDEDDEDMHISSTQEQDKEGSSSKAAVRHESITSTIESSYLREEEELIYEGDMDHEGAPGPEEEKDVLIVDVNSKELDLDSTTVTTTTTSTTSSSVKSSTSTTATTSTTASSGNVTSSSSNSISSKKLWIKGLATNVTAADLKTLMSQFGQALSAKIVASSNCKSQRFGHIVMATEDQCLKCISSLNGTELKGKVITVELTNRSFPGVDDKSSNKSMKTTPISSKKAPPTASKPIPITPPSQPPNKSSSAGTNSASSKRSGSSNKPSSSSKGGGGKSSSSGNSGNRGDSRKRRSTSSSAGNGNSKRIVSVEDKNGRKELFTTHKEEHKDRSRSPRNHGNRRSSPRGRVVSKSSPSRKPRSPHKRDGSPHRKVGSPPRRLGSPPRRLGSPPRRLGSPPPPRRLGSPPRRLGSPPRRLGSPPRRLGSPPRRLGSPPPPRRLGSPPRRLGSPPRRLGSPPRRLGSPPRRLGSPPRRLGSPPRAHSYGGPQNIHHRLGGRNMVDSVHRMEMKYREQLMSEREAIRNELHLEHAQKEQELLHQMRQMRERETRERDQQQYRIAELQKSFRERANQLEAKERELREREAREKERLATLERQKEKEMRVKLQQELEQNLKEKEMREKKILEEQAELLKAQEKAILEKEQRLKEREEKMREEAKRRQKEEQDKKERDREEEEKMRSSKRQYEFSSQAPSSKRPAMDDGRVFNRIGMDHHIVSDLSSPIAGASPIVKETHISPNLTYRRFEKNSGGRMQPHMGVEPAVMGVAGMFNQNQATRGKPADIPTSSNKFMHNYHTPGPAGATPYRLGTPPVGYGSTNTSSANVPSPAATSYPLPPTTTASNTVSHNVAELLRHNPELYSKAMQALNSMSGHGGAGYSHPYGGRLTSPYSSADLYQQQQQSSRYMNPGAASGGYKRNAREGGAHRISGQSIRGGPTHPYKRSN